MKDFFISYTQADEAWAEWIAWTLEEAGHSVVIRAWDFRPGGNFVLKMNEATEGTNRTIAVISEDYLNALYTQPEWAAAFNYDPKGERRELLPILVKACDLKGLLRSTIYIDLVGLPEEKARQEILDGLKERAKPDEAPVFPGTGERAITTSTERVMPNKVQFPGSSTDNIPNSEIPWNVPAGVPFFTGREDVLERLHQALSEKGTAAIAQRQAISGLGGIGKTQTAIEYAKRHHNEYKAVLWVVAESRESLISGFASIAGVLNLPERNIQDQSLTVKAVKRWLDSNFDWLLILDNADNPKLVEEFIPANPKGHILLTSRAQVFDAIGILNPLELEELSPEDAINFLLNRTGRNDLEPEEARAVEQLAQELDYLPLALEQAGAYIKELRSSFKDYITSYHQRGLELLEKGQMIGEYRKSVRTTWSLNFQQVEQTSKAAADLLRVSAFLNPDRIPIELIHLGAVELGPELSHELANVANDPLLLDEVLKPLIQYSLIHRDRKSRTYDIHRLVQAVLKDGMEESLRQIWAERVIKALSRALPDVDAINFGQWNEIDRLLPHVQICAELIRTRRFDIPEAAQLLNRTGRYLHLRARLHEAEQLYIVAHAIREKILNSEHPDIAASLHNLAWLYYDQGKYSQAESLYNKSFTIREQTLESEHPDIAASLDHLARLYKEQGKYTDAVQMANRALDIRTNKLGPEHPQTASTISLLGNIYYDLEEVTEAAELNSKALKIQEKSLGMNHYETAISLNNLATIYLTQNKFSEAESLLLRALSIYESAFGMNYPRLDCFLNNLAKLYIEQNKYAAAKELLNRSMNNIETVLGPEHPDIAVSLMNLGLWYRRQCNYLEAEQLYNRALKIREQTLGSDHPDVALTLITLGDLYIDQHKYFKGEPLLRRALPVLRKTFRNEHPYVVDAMLVHAALLKGMNRKGEAQRLEGQAKKIRAKLYKKNSRKN